MAEILHLRYGTTILEVKAIRTSLIDSLSEPEGLELTRLAGVAGTSHLHRSQLLAKHFATYSTDKSRQLTTFLGLPPAYQLLPPSDERAELEVVQIGIGEEVRLRPYLHSYQKELKDEIASLLRKETLRFMVQMPTGAGKTYTALEVVVDVMRAPRATGFVVWLVDSNELAEQALEAFRNLWKLKGDRPLLLGRLFNKFCPAFDEHPDGGVIFASFDKLNSILADSSHSKRLHVLDLLKRTKLLIVDEAHGSVARTYRNCIEAFADRATVRIIGLTATPGRPDPVESKELSQVFSQLLVGIKDQNGILMEDPIHFLQQAGFLATLHCELLETGVSVDEADEQRICRKLAASTERNSKIIDQIELAHQAEESSVVFACTLDHVFALKVMCAKRLIPCEVIVGATPQAERLEILRRFRERQFYILLNLEILSTGIDLPKLQKLILTRPIGSPVLYSQVIGRALRGPKNGGNASNKVVNLRDNLANYPNANLLYTHFWEDWVRH